MVELVEVGGTWKRYDINRVKNGCGAGRNRGRQNRMHRGCMGYIISMIGKQVSGLRRVM